METKILKEIQTILTADLPRNQNCISLYDVTKVIMTMKKNYSQMKKKYEDTMKSKIKSRYDNPLFFIHPLNNDKKLMHITFKPDTNHYREDIVLKKENNTLYIVKKDYRMNNYSYFTNVYPCIKNELSSLYDELLHYSKFINQNKYNIPSTNSNFLVNIKDNYTNIHINSPENQEEYLFSLNNYYTHNNCSYDNNDEKTDEIFKHIFIKIDDCPKWSKTYLYQIRQEQLTKENNKQNIKTKNFPQIK